MNTLQHSLVTMLKSKDLNEFKKVIPYVLLPDAIRCYTKERRFSHFETEPLSGESNVLIFPIEINKLGQLNLNDYIKKDIPLKSAAIGELSSMAAFEENNQHLDNIVYQGIKEHLYQDILFDDWIREIFDCSGKYEDVYKVNNQQMSGNEFRKFITEFEMDGLICLAFKCHEKFSIITNNQWFAENVFEPLSKVYPEFMCNSTCRYMVIPDEINKMITDNKWEELLNSRKYLRNFDYDDFYQKVIKNPLSLTKIKI